MILPIFNFLIIACKKNRKNGKMLI